MPFRHLVLSSASSRQRREKVIMMSRLASPTARIKTKKHLWAKLWAVEMRGSKSGEWCWIMAAAIYARLFTVNINVQMMQRCKYWQKIHRERKKRHEKTISNSIGSMRTNLYIYWYTVTAILLCRIGLLHSVNIYSTFTQLYPSPCLLFAHKSWASP